MKYLTTYRCAVEWLNLNLVLCNRLPEIDFSLYENMRQGFNEDTDIYQWYITNATESDVEWLEEHFGLLFTYSDMLDCYVLCVNHFGMSWRYVMIETDIENAARKEGEGK